MASKMVRTAVQTAVLMAILTMGSKLLGFVREMVMAGCFGTSYIVDSYVMAQSIPSILFAGIFSAVGTAYIPLFSQKLELEGKQKANIFTSQVIKILFVVSIVSSIVGLLFSDQFVEIFASGFEGKTAELTSFFLKVTFSYTAFTSIAGILEHYLQYHNTFLPQIIVGYTQNVITVGTIIISAVFNYYFLAFGLLIAYIIRLALFYWLAKSREFHYEKSNKEIRAIIKKIAILAFPVFIGSSISQINLFVDKTLASGLPEGSVSALNYASLLNGMVMTMTITIFTTIVYPKLAQANSLGNRMRFNEIASTGITLVFILALPCSLGAMLYSNQIVQIVYERGAFDATATAMTSIAYLCYSAGLLFMALNDLLLRIYYSMHDTKTPMIFAAISVIINVSLNLILVRSMALAGLALATSISGMCNTIMFYIGLKKRHRDINIILSIGKVVKIVVSAVTAVGISYVCYLGIVHFFGAIIYMRMAQVGVTVIVAVISYGILLVIFKVEEIKILKQLVKVW